MINLIIVINCSNFMNNRNIFINHNNSVKIIAKERASENLIF